MQEYFDNSIVTANIGSHAYKIEELKNQRNLAILCCLALGIICLAALHKYVEEQKLMNYRNIGSTPLQAPHS